jgi:hypothetical protein
VPALTGRQQHAASREGQQHAGARAKYGPPDLRPDLLQRYRFRFFGVRPGYKDALLGTVEACSWDDGAANRGAITTGSVTVRDRALGVGPQVHLDIGDQMRLEADAGGGYQEVWTMRVSNPQLSEKEGQRTFDLANDLDLLARSEDDFYFQAGPGTGKPNGWTFDEVIRHVCQMYGVRLGAIPKGKFRRKKSWSHRNVSPLDVFQMALNVERQHTGRRFVIRWARGMLWILPLQRSPHLLALGPSLIEAAYSTHLAAGQGADGINEGYFASAVTIRGLKNAPTKKDKKGHLKPQFNKIHASVESPASIRRFGYVRRVVWSPDAKTDKDLVEQARQYLAAVAKPIKSLTLTHAGMPFLRRGDAIKLGLGDTALRSQIVWVTEASFSLSPSDFTMVVTVTFDDPYVDKVAKRIQDHLATTQKGAGAILKKTRPKPKPGTARAGKKPSEGSGLPAAVNKAAAVIANDPTRRGK